MGLSLAEELFAGKTEQNRLLKSQWISLILL
jgi:hypothetical protein